MTVLHVVLGVAVLGASLLLFTLEGAMGIPTRFRAWMNPLSSPGLAMAGFVVSLPVGMVLMLPFLGNATAQTVVWGGCWSITVVVAAFLTARWWQPLYLSVVTWALFTIGGLFGGSEGQTVGGVVLVALETALAVGALASVGVLLRFASVWMSQRAQRPDHRMSRVSRVVSSGDRRAVERTASGGRGRL